MTTTLCLHAPPQVVIEFCRLCNWAHETWINHRKLFDDNPYKNELQKSFGGDCFLRLSVISQEYSLHQIAKLHDPAIVKGHKTLGINYIIEYGEWHPSLLAELKTLSIELNKFATQLRSARNKVLSHNDLETILNGSILGEFSEGEDIKYFETLQKFVNIVHSEVIGGPAPFNDLVINDITGLLGMLNLQGLASSLDAT